MEKLGTDVRWWPVEFVRSCWFCERGTAPGHVHVERPKEKAA